MPAVGLIVAAAVTAAGTVAAADSSSSAAKKAATLQSDAAKSAAQLSAASNDKALDFQKAAAENSYQNSEATRRADYDQEVARQTRLQALDQLIGRAPRAIPAYAPGVDPRLTGAPAPQGAAPAAAGPAPAPNTDYQSTFQQITGGKPLDQKGLLALAPQLQQAGFKITPPSAAGTVSKIGLPDGSWVRVLNGDTNVASPTVWVPQPSAAPSIGSIASASPNYAMPSMLAPTTARLSTPSIGSFFS